MWHTVPILNNADVEGSRDRKSPYNFAINKVYRNDINKDDLSALHVKIHVRKITREQHYNKHR